MKKFWVMNKYLIIKIVFISLAIHIAVILILGLYILSLIGGRDPYAGKYPLEETSTWVSDSPVFVIEYRRPPDYYENAYIIFDGEEYPVIVEYSGSSFTVYPADRYGGMNGILYGTWKYKDKKSKLVFIIERDYVFDSQYEKIVFTRQETQ